MAVAPRLENMPDAMTVQQVARVLQISPKLVYLMVEQKQLPAFHVGRCLRVSKKAVERLINGGDTDALVS